MGAVDRVTGWKLVRCKLSELEEVVSDFEGNLDKVLNGLGRVDQEHVSEEAWESHLCPTALSFFAQSGIEGQSVHTLLTRPSP